jgi:hypothetical protein
MSDAHLLDETPLLGVSLPCIPSQSWAGAEGGLLREFPSGSSRPYGGPLLRCIFPDLLGFASLVSSLAASAPCAPSAGVLFCSLPRGCRILQREAHLALKAARLLRHVRRFHNPPT